MRSAYCIRNGEAFGEPDPVCGALSLFRHYHARKLRHHYLGRFGRDWKPGAQLRWTSLRCNASNATSISCAPTKTGTYYVAVKATDTLGSLLSRW